MRENLKYLAIIVIAILIGFACEKSGIDEVASKKGTDNIQSVELITDGSNDLIAVEDDRVRVLTTMNDVVNEEVDEAMGIDLMEIDFLDEIIEDLLKSGDDNTCPSVDIQFLVENERFPRVITKTFDGGCTNNAGKSISGVMVITMNDRPGAEGSTREVSYESLLIGGNTFNGQKEIVYEGKTDNGEKVFRHSGALKVEKENGKTVYRIIDQRRSNLVERDADNVPVSRTWKTEGEVKVLKSNGVAYVMEIKAPVVKSSECSWPLSGEKEFKFFKDPVEIEAQFASLNELFDMEDISALPFKKDYEVLINFGDEGADCDNIAVKTIDGGEAEEITLTGN